MIPEFRRHGGGGGRTVWNSKGKGGFSILEFPKARGVYMKMPPVVGYGYFLQSPIGPSVLSISTDNRRKASAIWLRKVGYFLP